MRRTSSGGIAAPPMPATRSWEKSVVSTSGCSSTRCHCVGTPVTMVIASSRMRRSVSAADHGSPASTIVVRVGELVPHAGHVADVRERQHDETAVAGCGQLADVARDRRLALVVEHRALGRAGRAARPHDARRVGRVEVREAAAGGSAANALPARRRGPPGRRRRPSGTTAPSPTTVTRGSVR